MIKFDVSENGSQRLSLALDALSSGIVDKALMTELGEYAMFRVKARTMQGKDASNQPFKPYSKDYAFFRESKGHQTSPVNLFFRGHMLAAMDVDADDTNATIFFNDQQQAAKAHGHHHGSAKTGLPERAFFALSDDDVDQLKQIITERIDKQVKDLGLK